MITTLFFKELIGQRVFSVKFTKKNGTESKMTCRFGVKKGVTGKGMRYSTIEKNYVSVYKFDKEASGFRTLILANIIEVKFKGQIVSKKQLDMMYIQHLTEQFTNQYSTQIQQLQSVA